MIDVNKFGVIGLLQFHQIILPSHMGEFPFQKLQYVQKDTFFFLYERKIWYIDTKNNDEECCFWTKTQYSFILNYRSFGKGGNEGSLSKWNSGKIIETKLKSCFAGVILNDN